MTFVFKTYDLVQKILIKINANTLFIEIAELYNVNYHTRVHYQCMYQIVAVDYNCLNIKHNGEQKCKER